MKLLNDLQRKLNETSHLLTSSYIVGNGSDISESDFPALIDACDFVAIFHGYLNVNNAFDAYKARQKALIEEFFDNILKNINSMSHKILIGLPFASPECVLNPKAFLYKMIGYNVVCDIITKRNNSRLDRDFKPIDLAYTLQFDSKTKINSEIVFECSRSIANKIRFAMKRRLGGTMISSLHDDDVDGKCGFEVDTWHDFKSSKTVTLHIPVRNNTTFTLLRTINEAINVTLDEIQQDTSHSTRHLVSGMVLVSGFLAYLLVSM